jgi:hypothetical protein
MSPGLCAVLRVTLCAARSPGRCRAVQRSRRTAGIEGPQRVRGVSRPRFLRLPGSGPDKTTRECEPWLM